MKRVDLAKLAEEIEGFRLCGGSAKKLAAKRKQFLRIYLRRQRDDKTVYSKSKITKKLREWVDKTHALNRKLRRNGIEPRYTCGIRGGRFYEIRPE